jgi:hypothetical protein
MELTLRIDRSCRWLLFYLPQTALPACILCLIRFSLLEFYGSLAAGAKRLLASRY